MFKLTAADHRGVRSFGGAQRMGGVVNRSREVVLSPEEVLEATRKRRL